MRTTTAQEMQKCLHLMQLYNTTHLNDESNDTCHFDYDNAMCWPETDAGTAAYLECPFDLCTACNISFTDGAATRPCFPNGTWGMANYDKCKDIYFDKPYCVDNTCYRCLDDFREALGILTLVLSLISTLLLIISLIIFSCFESIQCRRLTIHKHLAVAFVVRFMTITVWILTNMYSVFQGCSGVPYGWLCKTILFLLMYSTMASTFWMFVEGAYLASRFTILAMRSSEGHIAFYAIVGWVLPFFFVSCWAISLEMQPDLKYRCWLPYTTNKFIWLLVGPTAFALTFNVIFMLIVIGILIMKLRMSITAESATIWKAIKATLLLVPLLGVSNLLLFFEPSPKDKLAHQAYMVFATALQHSQGIFVAVLYCFINAEVQEALKRRLQKSPLYYRYWEKNRWTTVTTQCDAEAEANGNVGKRNATKYQTESKNKTASLPEQGAIIAEGKIEGYHYHPQ